LPALALTGDVATLSRIADHEGWEHVFVHQIRYLGRRRDIALGFIPPDGSSGNVLRCLRDDAMTEGVFPSTRGVR
jgi:D-sedoheptulose 7-phosphate isomerase